MKSNPAVRPMYPSRYCLATASESLNRPFRASTRSILSWVFRLAVRPPRGARLSTRIFRPCSTFWKVAAEPWLFTWLATSWYMVMASASMEAASTLMAGSRTRSEKSSRPMVRSTLVKFRSTPLWVATFSSTLDSLVSWVDRAGPLRTAYWLGRRTFSVSPILAPWRAKRSSYSLEMVPTKFSFWCRPLCSPRVAGPGPPFRAAAGFRRRADYLITHAALSDPRGCDALRAAWPYSLAG